MSDQMLDETLGESLVSAFPFEEDRPGPLYYDWPVDACPEQATWLASHLVSGVLDGKITPKTKGAVRQAANWYYYDELVTLGTAESAIDIALRDLGPVVIGGERTE